MFGKTPIPLLLVASGLYWYGLSQVIGIYAPNMWLWVPLLPAILGFVLAVPSWAKRVGRTARRREWGWFAALLGFAWALPIVTLLYTTGGPEGPENMQKIRRFFSGQPEPPRDQG